MRLLPVVAVRPSLSKLLSSNLRRALFLLLSFVGLVFVPCSYAQQQTVEAPYINSSTLVANYLGRIGYNDPDQLAEALMRVEGLYRFDEGAQLTNPVSIVVHGPEVSIFQKQNYEDNKPIVDLAAKLTALGVLDISVCETRLNSFGADKESVYPFVSTVPFGPAEVSRLLDQENYVYF